MGTVKIGRYDHPSITQDFSGWIEPDDRSWIIFLDAEGRPCVYYPERDETGGVLTDGIWLDGSTESRSENLEIERTLEA